MATRRKGMATGLSFGETPKKVMGTVLSVAETLLSTLRSSELKEMPSIFGGQSQLEDLQGSIKTIIKVARAAEAREEEEKLSRKDQDWIEDLKDAVFEADDLFDELLTVAKQNQLLSPSQKMSKYFSPSKNPLSFAYRMSSAIKVSKKKLDAVAAKHSQSIFKTFETHHEPTEKTVSYVNEEEEVDIFKTFKIHHESTEKTFSYVNEEKEVDIIAREDELVIFLHTLLDPNYNDKNVSVLSIWGVGGVGKTALARLVYNHHRVKDSFPLRLWSCVSAQFLQELTVEDILSQILPSITRENLDQSPSLDQGFDQLRKHLAGKKYLLVLDDVTTEFHRVWRQLFNSLMGGATGSWILVTTRSSETATMTGDLSWQLSELSYLDSWALFARMALVSNPPDDLIRIGPDVVNGCDGVPLAIRVAGRLLYGQGKSKWLSVRNKVLANNFRPGIMSILKLSFYHLESPLKNCLRYCALFPKYYVIEKEMLISLWMAQGYIVPIREDQSLEDAAQEYFTVLLHRCFLQAVEQDAYGEIISCRLHGVIYEFACIVAGTEMEKFEGHNLPSKQKAYHVSSVGKLHSYFFTKSAQLRSLLHVRGLSKVVNKDRFLVQTYLGKCKCLRTLDLSNLGIETLPNSIGELLHLRYLDLSQNRDLKVLPKEITILVNLQTLILNGCHGLTKLPEDLSKLTNLRVLDIKDCTSLTCMPSGLGNLTSLHTLTEFVLVETSLKLNQWLNQLENLKDLRSLKGHLTIRIESPKNKEDARWEGAYLSNKVYLNCIRFSFTGEEVNERGCHEELMGFLQPHANIKGFNLCGYDSARMPGWITFLPNLVTLCLENCRKLQYLPYLGNLVHLKVFHLVNLINLEYIFEHSTASASGSNPTISSPTVSQSAEVASLFPSLQQLHVINLPKLKGWFKSEVRLGVEDEHMLVGIDRHNKVLLQSLFDQELESLIVEGCPKLESVSQGSGVEELSSCGAGTSSTKDSINRATANTHDSKVIEESLPHAVPDADSPFDDINIDDALLYCSLFPPEYEFEKIALLQLWLADGIFDKEETAGIFFGYCVDMKYFEVSRFIFLTGEAMYTFKGDNCLVSKGSHVGRIEDTFNSNDLSPEVSHVSVSCRSLKDSSDLCQFKGFKQLRTLIFLHGHFSSLRQVPRDFFLSLKLLRVLDLSHTPLEELPSSIRNMKCLRYLDLTKTPIKHLPEALDCLENLQTLKLRGCSNLTVLPKGMRKLEKLRHLEFDVLEQLRSMPEGMGALTNMRTLSAFIVGVEEEGRSIRQLKKMNNISGSFCISELQNVLMEDRAVEAADMCQKSQLRNLELRWSDSKDKDVSGHSEVLSSLQPHASLKELCISCYGGSSWPLWICDTTFYGLVNITLFMCENCTVLPSLGQLPALESLNIVGFNKLQFIDHNFYGGFNIQGFIAFPELKRLTIQDMPSLEGWRDAENPYFPKLLSLTVKQCPKLFSLCTLSSSLHPLEKLEITHCGMLASCLDEGRLPPLETLIIEECPLINERILKYDDQDWLKLLERNSDVWIDHQKISGSNSLEEEEDESD